MGESDMSILQRLLAIRERLSAQSAPPAHPSAADAAPQAADPETPAEATVSMWDLVAESEADLAAAEIAPASPAFDAREVPAREAPQRRSGRVKTRLIGFESSTGETTPAFDPARTEAPALQFPVGWLVIIAGPGRGTSIPLGAGVSQIGRGENQAAQLDFGDTAISREGHAAIAYDDEQRAFFIGHGGKANLVRLNGKPVLSTQEIRNGDELRIGETTLRFVALCDESFSWSGKSGSVSAVNGY